MPAPYRVMVRLSSELYAQLTARAATLPQGAATEQPQEMPVHHGRPGLPRATLQAIATERTRYPALTMKAFAQHLFDQGIYRGLARDGREVPADHSRLRRWVAQAHKAGLLSAE